MSNSYNSIDVMVGCKEIEIQHLERILRSNECKKWYILNYVTKTKFCIKKDLFK